MFQASVAVRGVDPSASLAYTNYFYAQDATSHTILGYNISWDAGATTIEDSQTFSVGNGPALPGTHLAVSALPNTSGGNDLVVFYQTNGSDISEFTRDLLAGQWTMTAIPLTTD